MINKTWTAARCNRLLRSIVTKLESLRKETHSKLADEQQTDSAAGIIPACSTEEAIAAEENCGDPSWFPQARRKCQYTYQSRFKRKAVGEPLEDDRKSKRSQRNVDAAVATPRLKKTIELTDAPPGTAPTAKMIRYVEHLKLEHMRQRRKNRFVKANALDGLEAALDTLLRDTSQATALSENEASETEIITPMEGRRGSPSLLSLCLRQVPRLIAEEEITRKAATREHEAEYNTSAEVYEWLQEEFEPLPGQGWPHLREVTRAHAIQLLGDAVKIGQLSSEATGVLIETCTRNEAYLEAQQLVSILTTTIVQPIPPPSRRTDRLSDFSATAGLVEKFSEKVSRPFLYRQLTALLSAKILPVEWVATAAFERHLIAAIHDLQNEQASPAELIEAIVLCACGVGDSDADDTAIVHPEDYRPLAEERTQDPMAEALRLTISTICVALCTNTLMLQSSLATEILNSLGSRVNQSTCLPENPRNPGDSVKSSSQQTATSIVLATGLLLSTNRPGHSTASEALEETAMTIMRLYHRRDPNAQRRERLSHLDDIASLISFACQWLNHKWGSNAGFTVLQRTVRRLKTYAPAAGSAAPDAEWALAKIALDAALSFAESTSQPEHTRFAEAVEKSVEALCRSSGGGRVAGRRDEGGTVPARAGYRWEDGICEWIEGTPARSASHDVAVAGKYGRCSKEVDELPKMPISPDSDRDELALHKTPCGGRGKGKSKSKSKGRVEEAKERRPFADVSNALRCGSPGIRWRERFEGMDEDELSF